jgi:hypothetical protein
MWVVPGTRGGDLPLDTGHDSSASQYWAAGRTALRLTAASAAPSPGTRAARGHRPRCFSLED